MKQYMKTPFKFLMLTMMMISISLASCQKTYGQALSFYGVNGKAKDTITNATTRYLYTPANKAYAISSNGNYNAQVYARLISGSPTLTLVLQSTLDSSLGWTNHFNVAGTDGRNCDSITSITATARYKVGIKPGLVRNPTTATYQQTSAARVMSFRWMCVQTGTGVFELQSKLLGSE